MTRLSDDMTAWLGRAKAHARAAAPEPRLEQVGYVEHVGDGVALVSGLPDARQEELLRIGTDAWGLAVTMGARFIGCVLLSDWEEVRAGDKVRGTGDVIRVPVGPEILGRVVDPLGRPLDDRAPPACAATAPIDGPAPAIVERDFVVQPLQTGILAVDSMIPLGRGQRELIIGDRKVGKTALAVDAIINQARSDVVCLYVGIGQKTSSVNRVIAALRDRGPMERTAVVVGEADSPPGLQWIAPYAAFAMGEYFMARGRHVLVVLDDLSKHAQVYRQLSLLLRRPPGREAYPGDVFYIHSRLLERSAKLAAELGGGSLTALPIAETQAGNISGYIPTNLISITDGQIYLEPKLFNEGLKPAVNIGKSVSRVGGKTQAPVMKALSGRLRLEYTQFLELEVFTRFGTMMDERTRRTVEHGKRIRAILTQPQYRPWSLAEQVALLLALEHRVLDGLTVAAVEDFKADLPRFLGERCGELVRRLEEAGELSTGDRRALAAHLKELAARFAGAGTSPAAPETGVD